MADGFYVKKGKSGEKSGAKSNWAWYLGIFVLILVSVSFILPGTGFLRSGNDSIYFGRYGKRKIEFAVYPAPTLFARMADQYSQNYMSMFASSGLDSQGWIRSMAYSSAFSQVLERYAMLDAVDKSGLEISDREGARFLLDNYFQDQDGSFSLQYWNSLTEEEKAFFRENAKDDAAIRHFSDDRSKIKGNDRNLEFIMENLGDARNFSMLVFKGERCEAEAREALERIAAGESLEDVKKDGQDIIAIDNAFDRYVVDSFYPTRPTSGDLGRFHSKLEEDDAVRDSLFSIGEGETYPEAISLSDDSWAIVRFDSPQSEEQATAMKGSVQGRVEYLGEGDWSDRVRSSRLADDKFQEGFAKLFPPENQP